MKRERYEANEKTRWGTIIAKNFIGGLMWGLGSVIGATMVLSIVAKTLSNFDFIPAVADFIVQLQQYIAVQK
jgi:hypothetical protein